MVEVEVEGKSGRHEAFMEQLSHGLSRIAKQQA